MEEKDKADQQELACPDPKHIKILQVLSPIELVVEYLDVDYDEIIGKLEALLTRDWEFNVKNKSGGCEDFIPRVGMDVSVASKDKSVWKRKRGKIHQNLPNLGLDKIPKYSVFLYDYGTFETCQKEDLAPLKIEHVNQLAAKTFIVTLPGLVPAQTVDMPPGCIEPPILIVGHVWSDRAIEKVQDWCKKNESNELLLIIYLSQSKISKIGTIAEFKSRETISDILVQNHLAIYDESLVESQLHPPLPKNEEKRKLSEPMCFSGRKRELPSSASATTASHNINMEKVLIYGQNVVSTMDSIKDLSFFKSILPALKRLGIHEGTNLQLSTWPQFIDRRNLFIVSSKSQKYSATLSYLIPLFGQLLQNKDKILSTQGKGPSALVICANEKSCREVLEMLNILTNYSENPNRIKGVCMEDIYDNDFMHESLRTEILITTPDVVVELIQSNQFTTYSVFERLTYMVFGDFDVQLIRKLDSVQTILSKFKQWMEKIKVRKLTLQLIFCSTTWSQEIDDAYKNITKSPVLVIGSASRAMSYAQIPIKVHFLENDDEKLILLKDLLKDEKIFIFCRKYESCEEVKKYLLTIKSEDAINMMEKNSSEGELHAIRENWLKSKGQFIIICTDEQYALLDIDDARTIIHYEMTKRKLDTFGSRYFSMKKFFRDISTEIEESGEEVEFDKKILLMSHVLLTKDEENLTGIVKTFQLNNAEISQDLIEFVQIAEFKEKEKIELCTGLKEYGFCHFITGDCPFRHFLTCTELCSEPRIPMNGEADFLVVSCKSPLRYTGQLLRSCQTYRDGKGNLCRSEWIDYRKESKLISQMLNEYYSQDNNKSEIRKIELNELKVGTKVALMASNSDHNSSDDYGNQEDQDNEGQVEVDEYVRGEVTEIIIKNDGKREVRIFLVDIGHVVQRDIELLFELPERFAKLPICTSEVIVSMLKPTNDENEFRLKHFSASRKLVENRILRGKILLSIENTIWVNPVVEMVRVQNSTTGVCKWESRKSIRIKLIDLKIAEVNKEHVTNMYNEICLESKGYTESDLKNLENLFVDLSVNELKKDLKLQKVEEVQVLNEDKEMPSASENEDTEDIEYESDENVLTKRQEIELEELNRKVDAALGKDTDTDDSDVEGPPAPGGFHEENEGFSFHMGDENINFFELMGIAKKNLGLDTQERPIENPKRSSAGTSTDYAYPVAPQIPNPSNTLKKVEVRWFQNDEKIMLTIHKADVRNFTCSIGEDRQSFSFISNDPPGYGFDLNLASKVERNITKAEAYGQYIRIDLSKRLKGKHWVNIVGDNEPKMWWLKQSISERELKDDDDSDQDQEVDENGESKQAAANESGDGLDRRKYYDYIPVDYDQMKEDENDSSDDSDLDLANDVEEREEIDTLDTKI